MTKTVSFERAREYAGDSTTFWFAVLERARLTGYTERAEEAVSELRRLGVQVRFSVDDGPGGGRE